MSMTWQRFGTALLNTLDLDPLYVLLAEAEPILGEAKLKRWLLAYWCFYSADTASRIVEQRDFYSGMFTALQQNWPHGRERRHFRGAAAAKALKYLVNFGSPEQVVDYMTQGSDFQFVASRVQQFPLFGPWISWKVADMAERVLALPIDFSDATLGIYRDPVQGAAYIKFHDKHHPITLEELDAVVEMVNAYFNQRTAPPYHDRIINIQEVETILCKYKAHCLWHYYPGMDIDEIAEGLEHGCDLAHELLRFLPSRVKAKRGAV